MEVEEGVRVAGDQSLWQRCGLGKECPVPVQERQLSVSARPHLPGRDDVENRGRGQTVGVVQRHPVGDTPTTVVAGDGETLIAQSRHGLDLIDRQGSLGVRGVIAARVGPQRRPVACEVGGDNGEMLGQEGCHRVPHHVCLRIAVQQQQRRSAAADAGEDQAAVGLELAVNEILEHGVGPSCEKSQGRSGSPAAQFETGVSHFPVPSAARRNAVA